MDRTQVRAPDHLLALSLYFAKCIPLYALDSIPWKSFRILKERVCVALGIRCVIVRTCRLTRYQPQHETQDRRPLAPAAVAKMTIKRDDDSIVEPEYVGFIIIFNSF